jgi:molybdopterin-guanine dinucleotide biosynthesis protein B
VGGRHDSGKTTLVERLIPILRARGMKVGAVKHTPHDVTDDVPGKDSARHLAAGADPSAFVRPSASTVRREESVELRRILDRDFGDCDLVLVEGYKSLPLLRIDVGTRAPYSIDFEGRDYSHDLGALAGAHPGRGSRAASARRTRPSRPRREPGGRATGSFPGLP